MPPRTHILMANILRTAGLVAAGLAVVAVSFLVTFGGLTLWDQQEQIVQRVLLKNQQARLEITKSIPQDPAKARVSDGIALADGSISPKNPNSLIRIHIRAYVSSDVSGSAAIAIFRDGKEEPIKIITKPTSVRLEEMIALFDITGDIAPSVGLHFRIGSADQRPIFLNNNRSGPAVESVITILEIARST